MPHDSCYMRILQLKKDNFSFIVKTAVKVLKDGGVVVYPTETAYGLGADFLNPQAVKKIYQIKGRSFNKPLPVLVSSLAMAKTMVKFDKLSLKLAKKYWPGPLTLILNSKFQIKNYKTLGLRISASKLATFLVKKSGRPITATSANLSGRGELYTAKEIAAQFKNKKFQPSLIIDSGRLPRQRTSTIVKMINGRMEILRRGKILPTFKL